jgi:hypothetical protein
MDLHEGFRLLCLRERIGEARAWLDAFPLTDVNVGNSEGRTLLHYAATLQSTRLLKFLLGLPQIRVNARNSMGCTPLHLACLLDSPDHAELLINHPDIDLDIPDIMGGITPLDLSASNGRHALIRKMIASGRPLRATTHGSLWLDTSVPELYQARLKCRALIDDMCARPIATRQEARLKLKWPLSVATHAFACVVFLCDGLLALRSGDLLQPTKADFLADSACFARWHAARFFSVLRVLPAELQMKICHSASGTSGDSIKTCDSENAFIHLASVFESQ